MEDTTTTTTSRYLGSRPDPRNPIEIFKDKIVYRLALLGLFPLIVAVSDYVERLTWDQTF